MTDIERMLMVIPPVEKMDMEEVAKAFIQILDYYEAVNYSGMIYNFKKVAIAFFVACMEPELFEILKEVVKEFDENGIQYIGEVEEWPELWTN